MTDVTRILNAIEGGDVRATDELLPLVYEELRKLATNRLAQEKPGQTLQATALVHEAYLRLVDPKDAQRWSSRGHFFAAAAEAMRRILVEQARHKRSIKKGGNRQRVALSEIAGDLERGTFEERRRQGIPLAQQDLTRLLLGHLDVREAVEADSGVPIDRNDFFATSKSYPFGIDRSDSEAIIRDPIAVTTSGGLVCVGEVPPNFRVWLKKPKILRKKSDFHRIP